MQVQGELPATAHGCRAIELRHVVADQAARRGALEQTVKVDAHAVDAGLVGACPIKYPTPQQHQPAAYRARLRAVEATAGLAYGLGGRSQYRAYRLVRIIVRRREACVDGIESVCQPL